MNVGFIILAHKNPKQVARLVHSLVHPNNYFFIHIDIKQDIKPFKNALKETKNTFFVTDRENGKWGDIGIVKATINAIKFSLEKKSDLKRLTLLSGQDYPIKNVSDIREFFEQNETIDFIETKELPIEQLRLGGLDRINNYSVNYKDLRVTLYKRKDAAKLLSFKGRVLNFYLKLKYGLWKERVSNLTHYYGSQWWSLRRETFTKILLHLEENPNFLTYHKYTLLPDEILIQTIVSHYAHNLTIEKPIHYIDWSENNRHPKNLTLADFNKLARSEKLFARKFDYSNQVLDKIDKEILSK
jgi:hypothetical protein